MIRVTQSFTPPGYFAMTMGTGIVSIFLHSFATLYPRHHKVLKIIGITFSFTNAVLFLLILSVFLIRYISCPAPWHSMLHHPAQSLFLGTLPKGFATPISIFAAVHVTRWGGASVPLVWTMWWIDVSIRMACCLGAPFLMMTRHRNLHETMTVVWLLPIVAPIVAAATGAVVASVLPDPQQALITIITSYVLWGIGVPLASIDIVIYFHRLANRGIPPHETIVSVFLPLGPLVWLRVHFSLTGTLIVNAGEAAYIVGVGVGIVMWVASILHRRRFPFNIGWWGLIFPLGTIAMPTLTLGEEILSPFFRILGTEGICVILPRCIVSFATARNAVSDKLFADPCLPTMGRGSEEAAEKERGVA
ncbi:hypothetical protein K458DRAFT_444720 [Lentithecium fluviatile CBS 122367]|uniref:C4-dicarboxylate transporter/malic acid transport protein n=1 Tax=Lentithecium fluviatile CBS 122367 TaxID=1168545 RepID=A0A6G1ITG9_9PLEO|nr:hypothetical protein K458DRAFT_444720 [Lentithecium fluviatile CBS 122367]